ncbi:hypothetical protein [Bacillus sp. SJS]|uniref:hypothetical protein n=1 Tax=Bacillus sp. SJS TaxID=1423321 RepID=UPI000689D755|nr:hypothetical protein [Bacillus sp. SJS]KZZ82995.1 hypothetical protein AS29_019580 [Bacillus sp. SJS]
MILRGGLSGLAGGLALGFFLKWIQIVTGLKVYTLLLNVDFVYSNPLPEWVEFVIHLIVAIFIGMGFGFAIEKLRVIGFLKTYGVALLITLPALFLYFPLSMLARKEVPSVFDLEAFGWWGVGHLVFAGVMAGVKRAMKNTS